MGCNRTGKITARRSESRALKAMRAEIVKRNSYSKCVPLVTLNPGDLMFYRNSRGQDEICVLVALLDIPDNKNDVPGKFVRYSPAGVETTQFRHGYEVWIPK